MWKENRNKNKPLGRKRGTKGGKCGERGVLEGQTFTAHRANQLEGIFKNWVIIRRHFALSQYPALSVSS